MRDLPPLPECSLTLEDILEDLPDDSEFWWNRGRTDYLITQMSAKDFKQLSQMMSAQQWLSAPFSAG